jgi:hypothetical protein
MSSALQSATLFKVKTAFHCPDGMSKTVTFWPICILNIAAKVFRCSDLKGRFALRYRSSVSRDTALFTNGCNVKAALR